MSFGLCPESAMGGRGVTGEEEERGEGMCQLTICSMSVTSLQWTSQKGGLRVSRGGSSCNRGNGH